jgi:hypothetical protein
MGYMNDDAIEDLKQFITATVHGETADIRTDLAGLRRDMDRGLTQVTAAIADLSLKVDTIADAHASDLHDHEQRITALEHPAAAA